MDTNTLERKKTIAEEINGLKESEVNIEGQVTYDPKTNRYTFPDGSQAYLLTLFNDCKAYITPCLSTSSKAPFRVWKSAKSLS